MEGAHGVRVVSTGGSMASLPNRIANAVMRPLLRSPLHGLVSRNVMLITFTGRKSGRTYTTPVGYAREDDTLITSTLRSNRWWKNLVGGVPVTLDVQGKRLNGKADVVLDNLPAMAATFRKFYQLASWRALSDEEAMQKARERVIIRIRLQP
jgi:hypothetical protein